MQFQELSARKDVFCLVWSVIKVHRYSCKFRFCLCTVEYTSNCK